MEKIHRLSKYCIDLKNRMRNMSKNKLFSLKKNLSTNKTKLNKRLKRIKIKKKNFTFLFRYK